MSGVQGTKRESEEGPGEGQQEVENDTKKQKLETTEEEEELSADAGVLIVSGATNWDLVGRKDLPKGCKAPPPSVNVQNLWGPHIWKEKIRVKGIASSCVSCHSAIITEDGRVMTWGRNDCGQLGLGDTVTRYKPEIVKDLEGHNIVSVSTGRSHTLFLTDKGTVFSCGSDKMGQLGQGTEGKDRSSPAQIDYDGKPIIRLACGAEFSMILDLDGNLYSFGSPEYGQLGHNTDGKYLEKSKKMTFICEKIPRMITKFVEKEKKNTTVIPNVTIKDVKCGTNHTIAVDEKGKVYTWGFAGYGRLGHSETKDEMIPRLVKNLENFRCVVTKIAAGSTFCLAAAANKMLYFWGQTKPSGEATMYPKTVQDLSGWNIKSVACANKSIVIAAEETLISWGPSPTYGELGYGEGREKSSTTAKEVKPLEGIIIKEVSCGFGHTLMIGKDQTAEDRTRLTKLPKW